METRLLVLRAPALGLREMDRTFRRLACRVLGRKAIFGVERMAFDLRTWATILSFIMRTRCPDLEFTSLTNLHTGGQVAIYIRTHSTRASREPCERRTLSYTGGTGPRRWGGETSRRTGGTKLMHDNLAVLERDH